MDESRLDAPPNLKSPDHRVARLTTLGKQVVAFFLNLPIPHDSVTQQLDEAWIGQTDLSDMELLKAVFGDTPKQDRYVMEFLASPSAHPAFKRVQVMKPAVLQDGTVKYFTFAPTGSPDSQAFAIESSITIREGISESTQSPITTVEIDRGRVLNRNEHISPDRGRTTVILTYESGSIFGRYTIRTVTPTEIINKNPATTRVVTTETSTQCIGPEAKIATPTWSVKEVKQQPVLQIPSPAIAEAEKPTTQPQPNSS